MLNSASYVICYHRIHPKNIEIFQWQLKFLKKNKKIARIYEIENLETNSVIITFDDGFFDNFVYAYPILKKLQIPATIFISTAYINSAIIRNTLDDYWSNRISLNELQKPNKYDFNITNGNKEFLSWEEIDIMYRSGLISFESHGHHHLKHFVSENEKISHFKGFRYFKEKGKFETKEERRIRLFNEMESSRNLIKKNLGYFPEHFCWQWGEYDNFSLNIGKEVGFKFFYTTEKGIITNRFEAIPRISASFSKKTFIKRNFIFSSKIISNIYNMLF